MVSSYHIQSSSLGCLTFLLLFPTLFSAQVLSIHKCTDSSYSLYTTSSIHLVGPSYYHALPLLFPSYLFFFFFKFICVFSQSFLGNYQLHWSSFSLKFVVILLLSKWVVFHLLCTILLASFYTVQAGMSWGSVQAETVSLEPCLAHSIGQKLRKGSD